MRIIAGTAKGRTILGPGGSGTRPMTDRAREALFSSLGPKVPGARVLDLYAGNRAYLLAAQRMKHHGFIDAVDEFRPEVLADDFHHRPFHALVVARG